MNQNTMKVMTSSKSDKYGTPVGLFRELEHEFQFTVDVCATEENAKCPKYFTPAQNGLTQSWEGERVFMNPPYSKIKQWIEKAWLEKDKADLIVALVPARTDTRWFHDLVYEKAEIRFIRRRIVFAGMKHNAPFPSMLIIWRNIKEEYRHAESQVSES